MTSVSISKTSRFPLAMVILVLISTQVLIFGPRLVDQWVSSAIAGFLTGAGIMLSFVPEEKRSIGKWAAVLIVTAVVESVVWRFGALLF